MSVTKDVNGAPVQAGDRILVKSISQSVIDTLPTDEQEKVSSMKGMVLEVYEVDEYKQAWVEAAWEHSPGKVESHSLGLEPHEMELVGNE